MRASILCVLALGACSGGNAVDGINDPYEPMNRRFHAFNVGVDAKLLKPVSGGMKTTGQPGVKSQFIEIIGNFGSNLSQPGKAVNHLLQGKVEPAVKTTFRFFVNSTLGLGGFLDPATADFALPEQDTDFGQTLATWGVGEGAYLELPLIGPSTERDALGKVVDIVIDPMGHLLNRDEMIVSYGARVVSKAGKRAKYGDAVDSVLYGSADSYAQTRLIWLQHRRHELGQEGEAIDPYSE